MRPEHYCFGLNAISKFQAHGASTEASSEKLQGFGERRAGGRSEARQTEGVHSGFMGTHPPGWIPKFPAPIMEANPRGSRKLHAYPLQNRISHPYEFDMGVLSSWDLWPYRCRYVEWATVTWAVSLWEPGRGKFQIYRREKNLAGKILSRDCLQETCFWQKYNLHTVNLPEKTFVFLNQPPRGTCWSSEMLFTLHWKSSPRLRLEGLSF